MKKLSKKTLKSLVSVLTIALIGVVVLGGVNIVKATGGNFSWGNVEQLVADGLLKAALSGQPILGASGTRFPNGISANATSPSAGEVRGTTLTITGAATTGGLTASGDNRASSLIKTGSIATFTNTSTATAANVCDNPLWTVTPVTSTPTITLPATSTLFADCLTTNGDTVVFSVKTITTSTILVVGTGGNADLNSTLTITADKSAKITIIRDSATTYLMQVTNYNS